MSSIFIFSSCSQKSKSSVEIYPSIFRDKIKNLQFLKPTPQLTHTTPNRAYVFIDATLSMQGFVIPSDFTIFCNSIRKLINILTPKFEVSYFKFGEEVRMIDLTKVQFCSPSFYREEKIFRRTLIENVVDSALKILRQNYQNLIVIITDLYQDRSAIERIVNKFKYGIKDILLNILSISITLIKSEYDGTIFDIAEADYKFRYRETNDTLKFRPFYLICIGPSELVDDFLSDFSNNFLSQYPPSIIRHLIVSSNLGLSSTKLNYDGQRIVMSKNQGDSLFIFRLKSESLSQITLEREINLQEKAILPLIHPQIQFYQLINDSLIQAQPLFDCKVYQDTFRLRLTLQPVSREQKIEENIKYIAYIALAIDRFNFPQWVDEHDLKIDRLSLSEWMENPAKFPGSKTYNLKNFISSLSSTLLNNLCIQDIVLIFEK